MLQFSNFNLKWHVHSRKLSVIKSETLWLHVNLISNHLPVDSLQFEKKMNMVIADLMHFLTSIHKKYSKNILCCAHSRRLPSTYNLI